MNLSDTSNIILNSLLLSVGIIIVIPLIGSLVNLVITGILRILLGLIDPSGTLFWIFVCFLTFPGILMHELSHALFAFVTGAKINNISFYNLQDGNLGCVEYTPRGPWILQKLQMFLSSCAPVIVGLMIEAAIINAFISMSLSPLIFALLVYLMISALVHMEMSLQDLINYASGSISFFIPLFVICLAVLKHKP